MERKEIKRRAELYSAMAEGKTIQIKDMSGEWHDVEPEKLDCIPDAIAFRIKPEAKYRPFKSKEECCNEMLKHQPFGWVKSKTGGSIIHIGHVYKGKEVWVVWATNETNAYSASDIFANYVFTDGTPFGIKEEE